MTFSTTFVRARRAATLIALCALASGPFARATDTPAPAPAPGPSPVPPPARRWTDTADLGVVLTTGNSRVTNVSLNNVFEWKAGPHSAEFRAQALRVDSIRYDVRADTSVTPGRLIVTPRRTRTTEQYDAGLRYARQVHERLAWFVSARREQNEPAGLDQRLSAGGGVSFLFPARPRRISRLEGGFDGVSERFNASEQSYVGLRLGARHEQDVNAWSRVTAAVEVLENLRDRDDLRINADAGITMSINSRLALKTSYTVKYDGQPQTRLVPVTGADPLVFTYRTTDTVFSTSVVVKF